MNMPQTDCTHGPMETGITNKTDTVSNGAFLRAVFGDNPAEVRPVVVSFEGSPASVPAKAWFGRPWAGNANPDAGLPASANNYFSLAVFRPDEAGQ